MNSADKIGSAFLRMLLLRMKALGFSQTALAKRMNISLPYVTKVLSGDVNISFRTATKFAQALQMDFLPVLKPAEDSKSESNHELGMNETMGGCIFEIARELNSISLPDMSVAEKETKR